MIQKRAKPHKVELFIRLLNDADRMLCNAALANVLTKRGDELLRWRIEALRNFANDVKRKSGTIAEQEKI